MKDEDSVHQIRMLQEEIVKLLAQNEQILMDIKNLKIINDELVKKNKALMEDNIALQNSLKAAAAVGIKPQNYTTFNGFSSRGEMERGTYLGEFLGTAYTPSKDECGNNKGITNSGKPIIPGVSIAIDDEYWPYGTVFYIKGLGYAVAMDTGNAIKGGNRFDFAVFDKRFAKKLGSKYWEVYLVKMGNGKVAEVGL
jgi:3D (Asp-Asp-Asp) domain-containing protein/FtsZ-binding cell division protein ZapB